MKNVHKIIKDQTIIQDLNLQVTRGQILALCGGNGAGKSTILRMIAGILQPSQGEIWVDGLRWMDNRKRYAELIGYMPDDYHFNQGLTAQETMTFWAKLRGLTKARAVEVLAEVGLEKTGTKPVSSFSKGMRQRILFAQALLARPALLVMDEPTNGLDPYWMESFIQLINKAAADGQTILFSTHQLQIAEVFAHRIVFLRDGAVSLEGTGEELRGQLGSARLQDAFAELFGIIGTRK
ncbi:ABC-type multidrug transport system ATPase subunit [Paenibacillus baekrokdamisoli]|nr:ABC-type multidrug transport system ATPase subunit [Paenibacillus baekrokdamisoli]